MMIGASTRFKLLMQAGDPTLLTVLLHSIIHCCHVYSRFWVPEVKLLIRLQPIGVVSWIGGCLLYNNIYLVCCTLSHALSCQVHMLYYVKQRVHLFYLHGSLPHTGLLSVLIVGILLDLCIFGGQSNFINGYFRLAEMAVILATHWQMTPLS